MATMNHEKINPYTTTLNRTYNEIAEYFNLAILPTRVCLKTQNCTIPYFLIKYKKQSIGDYSHGTKTLRNVR